MNPSLFLRFLVASVAMLLIPSLILRADSPASSAVTVSRLRCEYLKDPLGIGVAKPRLSWIIESTRRGEVQTAYQIFVASSQEMLDKNQADLWDSGKVMSDATAFIEYGGAALSSRQPCRWKVRTWDGEGHPSDWSASARWEMGLLQATDWQAKWIDAPIAATEPDQGNLTILKATYEATDGAGSKDVTDLLSKMVKDNTLSVRVTSIGLGGDPAYLHVKQLRVSYSVDGKKREVTAEENATLGIPARQDALHYLRKDFAVGKTVAKARLFATALGLYELHLNGKRVGDHIFAPDWTDYNKRVRYQDYDVTSLVKPGANTLAGFVGNGWYSGTIGNGAHQAWGTVPALLAQLEVTYTDGTVDFIVSNASWKIHPGPIVTADFMMGENYDAQKEIAGWDEPGLDLSDWKDATERPQQPLTIDAQIDQPVRQTGEIHPKTMTEPNPGKYTFDLGQNMVGFVRFKVTEPAGTKITLRHAEMLSPDGTIYTANLRSARSTDTYICKGGREETWQPHFTFHGFRYVEISGLTHPPTADTLEGIVIGTDIPRTGEFSCVNADINQLQSNIQWGMRGNYLSVPTDCPQRNERMGWMGDAEVFIRTAAYNGDVAAFFTKWLVDVDDAQGEAGTFTDVSPIAPGRKFRGGTPAWGDAGVICPFTIYLMYGDKRILEQHLPAMTKWVDWCQAHSTNLIRDHDRGSDYGDWLAQGENTSKELIGTAYFAYSTSLLSKSYRAVGDTVNAGKYGQLFEQIKAAFDQKYVSADGHIQGGTQACYDMALRFGLLPDDLRLKAGQYLADDVESHQDHLTTGFVGVSYLLTTLTWENQVDTAYRVFLQDSFPSWLFSVKHGATTIWERWDGWTPEKGFQNPGMNSFNHYSLGSCGEWMFDSVAGIGVDSDQPGFKHIVIHPRPNEKMTSAEGSFDSIHGKITTKWKVEAGRFSLEVTIPANTTATVYVPTTDAKQVMESGKPVDQVSGVKVVSADASTLMLEVPSGSYSLTSPMK
jgi:alpha-L-rhamnosidase